ncbi:villin headpiece, Villin/Gelsolin, ADF-H/Gelsolin-like domain protein [Artemisia annua]|uniref:Villin headpiece, Villin/Gelsolin, ADF-H/Gelsolin-like domain protein n=1 Tax=Artemisia annua TaxID=35608 RepID=A0A2U1QMQ9_ARTAN|nr:villin headpiece, Villin/Gelsolin, ADF-H/Gelsolin-like domain protein [Artemisia annua]
MAARLATTMFSSLKGRPIQGYAYCGKEPLQFVAILQPVVVLKSRHKDLQTWNKKKFRNQVLLITHFEANPEYYKNLWFTT